MILKQTPSEREICAKKLEEASDQLRKVSVRAMREKAHHDADYFHKKSGFFQEAADFVRNNYQFPEIED